MKCFPLPARPACLAAVIALSATLAGCAEPVSTRYPSLLPRAIETRSDALPETAPVVAEADPATDSALAEQRKTLAGAVKAFAPAANHAEQLARAARGSAAGSERWIAAQSALAELDGYRATVSGTLTDIESLALARAAENKPDYPAIAALRAEAQTALDSQATRITAISAMLPSG